MNKKQTMLVRAMDKKFSQVQNTQLLAAPSQGWIRTIRDALGMTSSQLAKRLGVSQARIIQMEQNESNLKLSTLKKIAQALDCSFAYGLVPKKPLSQTIEERALKKARSIASGVNVNMALENQAVETQELIDDTKNELLEKNISSIWD